MFPAVFIAILARTIQAPWQWAVAAVAAGVALAVKGTVGGTWHIAVAGLGASVLGVWLAPRDPAAARRRRPRSGDEARPPPHVRRHGGGHLPDARAAAGRAGPAAPPGWLERYFAALPIALLTALALPLVLLAPAARGARRARGWMTDLPAAAVVALLARRTGHLLVAVAGGVLLVALLRALLG